MRGKIQGKSLCTILYSSKYKSTAVGAKDPSRGWCKGNRCLWGDNCTAHCPQPDPVLKCVHFCLTFSKFCYIQLPEGLIRRGHIHLPRYGFIVCCALVQKHLKLVKVYCIQWVWKYFQAQFLAQTALWHLSVHHRTGWEPVKDLGMQQWAAWRMVLVKCLTTESTVRNSQSSNDTVNALLPLSLFHYLVCMVDVFKIGCCSVNANRVMVTSMKIGKERPLEVYTKSWATQY